MMKNSGFTLVEILIVVALVAILVTLAIPSFENSIRKSRRADAQTALIQFTVAAERIYTQSNSYTAVTLPANSDYYTYTFPVAVTAMAYTIRATPTALQNNDGCGVMTLTQTGQRTHTGTETDCW